MSNQFSFPGLVPDPRSPLDISKDYQHEEVAPMAVQLNWARDMSNAPVYSIRDQDGSSSCVSQAGAKALEILTGIVQSAHPPYRRRSNYPNLGMYLQDYGNIVRQLGTTTEAIDPSQKMTEAQMNGDVMVETPLKEAMYITADFRDIDVLATAIETQKHCILTIKSSYNEWDVQKPTVLAQPTTFGHAICGTYYFTENGEKCILIDESWGLLNIRRRILTETFIKTRGTGAMYFISTPPLPAPQKPKFSFTVPLQYDQTSLSVKYLQDVLKYEGFFPTSIISTAYYGEITRKGVLAWQIKHNVASLSELTQLQGRRVGAQSLAVLNSLYN